MLLYRSLDHTITLILKVIIFDFTEHFYFIFPLFSPKWGKQKEKVAKSILSPANAVRSTHSQVKIYSKSLKKERSKTERSDKFTWWLVLYRHGDDSSSWFRCRFLRDLGQLSVVAHKSCHNHRHHSHQRKQNKECWETCDWKADSVYYLFTHTPLEKINI